MVLKPVQNPSRIVYLRKQVFLQCCAATFSKNICLKSLLHKHLLISIRRSSFNLKPYCVKTRNVKSPLHFSCCHTKTSVLSQHTDQRRSSKENQSRQEIMKRTVEKMAAVRNVDSLVDKTVNQNFDYFLVLDFEATCDNEKRLSPQEIIEFPVLKVNTKTCVVDSTFHQYVRPLFHPQLTPFCTELTGIVQEMVDNQKSFPEVLKDFNQWMELEGLLNPEIKSIFVTCGDWDLKSMLPRQCETSRLPVKSYFSRWINIKKSYADVTRTFPKGMMHMLTGLNLQHVGRHHSGIDDCRNIANIVVELMKQGYLFRENGRLT